MPGNRPASPRVVVVAFRHDVRVLWRGALWTLRRWRRCCVEMMCSFAGSVSACAAAPCWWSRRHADAAGVRTWSSCDPLLRDGRIPRSSATTTVLRSCNCGIRALFDLDLNNELDTATNGAGCYMKSSRMWTGGTLDSSRPGYPSRPSKTNRGTCMSSRSRTRAAITSGSVDQPTHRGWPCTGIECGTAPGSPGADRVRRLGGCIVDRGYVVTPCDRSSHKLLLLRGAPWSGEHAAQLNNVMAVRR